MLMKFMGKEHTTVCSLTFIAFERTTATAIQITRGVLVVVAEKPLRHTRGVIVNLKVTPYDFLKKRKPKMCKVCYGWYKQRIRVAGVLRCPICTIRAEGESRGR